MPGLNQQSADVRFREIDLSQTLRNRSTANGAMCFVSKKGRPGRVNQTSYTDFVAEYGERDASVSFGHYCARDFFDQGNYLDCVRVLGGSYAWAGALLDDDGSGVTRMSTVSAGITNPNVIDWTVYTASSSIPLVVFYPKAGPGSYANRYAVRVTSQNIDKPTGGAAVGSASGGFLTANTYQFRVSAISAVGETLASTLVNVTTTGSTSKVTFSWTPVVGARGYNVYGRLAGSEGLLGTVGATTYSFVDDGSVTADGSKLPITISGNLPPPTNLFLVSVYDLDVASSVSVEDWTCTLKDFTNGNGVQLEISQQINAFSKYISVVSNVPGLISAPPVIKSTAQITMSGGNSGTAPTNGQIAQAWLDNFSDTEKVRVNTLINAGYTDVGVQKTMATLATTRGDSVAVLDTPSAMQSYQDAITFRQLVQNINTSYAALYTSDIFITDNFNGKQLYIPSSGAVAGVYAKTDRIAGPQYAPAGLNRAVLDNVLKLRKDYTDPQRTQLFNAQVNYLRTFIGAGTSVFEQVTLQNKVSALSWVAVRRMINVIKGGVKDFLMYSLHEPNDDFLRRQIVTALTEYLNFWKDARGLLDFKVIADKSNNPDVKYNLGILTVTIILTPVIAVHEIGVDIVITKAGVSFSEINISALG